MNNIGLLIKMSRIQQNMKQITLAKGICSTSYLSKIENNQTVPSDDVLQLLLNRLNLDFQDLSTEEEGKFLLSLFSLYKEAIIERNRNVVEEGLLKFSDKQLLFKESKNFYTYNLLLLRLHLIHDPSSTICISLKNVLVQMENDFGIRQKFIFHLNCGIFDYIQKDYIQALSSFEKSLKLISEFHLEEWELADFYNAISLSYLAEGQILNTIEYASKSLSLYRNNLLFKRAFDCYIVLGIAFKRNLNFKNAEENFLLAKKIVLDLNLHHHNGIINYNLGSLAAIQGDSNKAIQYFEESLNNFEDEEDFLTTIFSIVQEYSKHNNVKKVEEWCQKGLVFLSSKESPFSFHFNVYLILHNINLDFEDYLIKAINYFEQKSDYHHAHKYSILLGNKYSDIRKYKNATTLLQKANCFLYKIKTLNYWEDL
ncbi:MAG: helix-turn-helix domain-containing protein [Paenisporosarcina sp.]